MSDVAPTAIGRSTLLRVAVAGNPNSGKTTLFNALTGLRHHVGNYPGVTVEKREGRLTGAGAPVTLLDLPGTYSLSARSPDERVARDALLGRMAGAEAPDLTLVVVDAANLERNLYLAAQVLELGRPVVIACNMLDMAEAAGLRVDCAALSAALGVPVVGTVGTRRIGLEALRASLLRPSPRTRPVRGWRLPDAIETAVGELARTLMELRFCDAASADGAALLLMVDHWDAAPALPEADDLPSRVRDEIAAARREIIAAGTHDLPSLVVEQRYAWIGRVVQRAVGPTSPGAAGRERISDRIDRVLTHRVFGALAFAVVMFLMFVAIFSGAEPLMGMIEAGQGFVQDAFRTALPPGPLCDLLADGVIGGVGAVVVFFPQICILFLFIALLEDSGYMARAAFLMDRLMQGVGLHGKSFIPLLSSYACAVPGIMATRTIENPRDRLATIMVAPLMSCSARLPVYITIIGAVFGASLWLKAGVIFAMYVVGTVAALLMAAVFKRTVLRGPRATFLLELPPYHLPRPGAILRAMWDRSRLFLTRAGTIIAALCVVMWALAYFPRHPTAWSEADRRAKARLSTAGLDPAAVARGAEVPDEVRADLKRIRDEAAGEQLRHSWIGRLGHVVEPALRPLGFDWKIGVGILSSFAAREVFVSTMGVVYNVGSGDDDTTPLRERMRAARWESGPRAGGPIYTTAAGLSLMVFYVLCCQCVSTLAVVRRETNSWRWPAIMFTYMTVLAYVGSLAVYQVGTRLGGGLS